MENNIKNTYYHLNSKGDIVEAVIDGVKYNKEEYAAHRAAHKAAYVAESKKMKMAVSVSSGNAIIPKLLEFVQQDINPVIFLNDGRNTNILYNWAKEKGAEIRYRPVNWKEYGKRAAFINNQRIVEECLKDHIKLFIFWDGEDAVVKDLYMRCLKEKVMHEAILLNEEDELVQCDDFIDALYKMRNELIREEDGSGELYDAIMWSINRLRGGWEKPDFLHKLQERLNGLGLFLDIGFNTGWSIDDENGGNLSEESEYDGFTYKDMYA